MDILGIILPFLLHYSRMYSLMSAVENSEFVSLCPMSEHKRRAVSLNSYWTSPEE